MKKHAPKSCAQSYATLFCWCNSWGWMQHQLGSTSYKSLGFHPSSTSHSFTRPGRLEVAVLFWGRDWERGVFAIVFILWFLIFVSILVGLRILFLSIGGRNPVKQSVCIYIYIHIFSSIVYHRSWFKGILYIPGGSEFCRSTVWMTQWWRMGHYEAQKIEYYEYQQE